MSHSVDVAHGHQFRTVEGEQMEKGAFHLPPAEGKVSLWVLGEFVTCKVPSQKTGGAYALFEATANPGAGPPPHVHHREDESFYVLEGEFEFSSGEEVLRAGAGSLLYFPKGTLHAHRNVGEEGVGRMLLTQTPGGLYERFFEEAGRTMDGGDSGPLVFEEQPEAGRIVALAAQYGIEIPPPTAEGTSSGTFFPAEPGP